MTQKTEQEFQTFLESFGTRLWHVQSIFQITLRLEEFQKLRMIYPAFFQNVRQASWNETIVNLFSLCDDKSSWSLMRFLETIKQNRELFSEENWTRRVGSRKDSVPGLSAIRYKPLSSDEITEDIKKIKKHPTISKVIQIRHNIVAHVTEDWLAGEFEPPTVSITEVRELIDFVFGMINKYYHLFSSSEYGKVDLRQIDAEMNEIERRLELYV